MRTIDLTPLTRSTIGYDRLGRLFEAARQVDAGVSFPPYNIEKSGDESYRIAMAVAGYGPDALDVTAKDNTLVIAGKSEADANSANYLHRGIARRAFVRRFDLAETVRVTGASLENGLLNIDLVNEIPEAKRPRRIPIEVGAGRTDKQIEATAAA